MRTDGLASVCAHFHPPGLPSRRTGSAVVFDEYLRVLTVLTVPPESVRRRRECRRCAADRQGFAQGFASGFGSAFQFRFTFRLRFKV